MAPFSGSTLEAQKVSRRVYVCGACTMVEKDGSESSLGRSA